jgi:hypothetical protein
MYYLSFIYFGYIFSYFKSIDFNIIIDIYKISMPKDIANGVYSGIPALGACLGAFLASKFLIKKYSRK